MHRQEPISYGARVRGDAVIRHMLVILVAGFVTLGHAEQYDLVIANGRVMDPASGLDAVMNVGISNGSIVKITDQSLQGDRTIDARGLVVAPGFIDLHAHGQDPRSNRFQAADGVTTALELEIGRYRVAEFLASRQGTAPIHYGATSSHNAARVDLFDRGGGDDLFSVIGDPSNSQSLTDVQTQAMLMNVEQGLLEGGLGIGTGITYVPGASHTEIYELFKLAARYKVPVFTHIRQARYMGGDTLAPLQEVLSDAAATGAALHVVHFNSSMDEDARVGLELLRGMRTAGVDVTTESYPYTAGSTRLESALFDDYQGDYSQLQWTATGERLTQDSFKQYREQGGWVIIHGRSEETNTWLIAQDDVMVASDGVPFVGDFSHPRSAGTFARVLGRYARDKQALDLMAALKKMTIDPATRLQSLAPVMRLKGRVQEGAHADITIFDANTILDRATYLKPAQTSQGIVHVLVKGTLVVQDGQLLENVFPGEAIRSELSRM